MVKQEGMDEMIQMMIVAVAVGILSWFFGCLAVIEYKYHRVKEFINLKIFLRKKKIVVLLLFLCIGIGTSVLFETYGFLWTKSIRYLILMYGMLVIAYIDAKSRIIPNKILLVLLGIRAIWLILELVLYSQAFIELISSAMGGLIIGFILFIFAYAISKKGIGMGDVKLISVIGFYTGVSVLYSIILFSLILCILYSVVQMLRKKITAKSFVPFGPFVAMGTIIAICLGM